jgi:hypothetical protein
MTTRASQCVRLLGLLRKHEGEWVELPEILSLYIGSYTRRIFELREALKPEGYIIEQRDEWEGRERHSAYRLIRPVPRQLGVNTEWFEEYPL